MANEFNGDCKCNLQDAQSPVIPQRTDNTIGLFLNIKHTCKKQLCKWPGAGFVLRVQS